MKQAREQQKEPQKEERQNRSIGDNKPSNVFQLTGAPKVEAHHLYIQNLSIPQGASNGAIIKSVIEQAKKHDIRIMSCMVKRNRYIRDQVGCKITVPKNQVYECKFSQMWGKGIDVRDWEFKPPRRSNYRFGGAERNHWRRKTEYDDPYRFEPRVDDWNDDCRPMYYDGIAS